MAWASPLVLGFALIADVAACDFARGAEQHETAKQEQRIAFDIPSQPLAAALESYGDTTGLEVLYKSSLAVGRRSKAVSGLLAPEAALQTLLEGTGLTAYYLADHSLALVPVQEMEGQEQAPTPLPAAVDHYYARIQSTLREALCATSGNARPGSYQVTAQLWIDLAGRIARYARLDSTGAPEIDRNIDRMLRDLNIGAPPPKNFALPVTVVVMPLAPGVTVACGAGAAGAREIKAGP